MSANLSPGWMTALVRTRLFLPVDARALIDWQAPYRPIVGLPVTLASRIRAATTQFRDSRRWNDTHRSSYVPSAPAVGM